MCEARGPTGCHLTLVLYLAVTGEASVFPDVSYPELGLRVWAFRRWAARSAGLAMGLSVGREQLPAHIRSSQKVRRNAKEKSIQLLLINI